MTADDVRFGEVYNRFFRHVYGYCRRRSSPDRVDDAVADVFLVVWRRIGDVPESDEVLPWLYGIAYKVLSTQWRGRSRVRRLEERLAGVGITPVKSVEDYVITAEESAQVFKAMGRLKPTDREILRLAVWEELPHAQIGAVLGISVGAVKQRAYEARKKLTREYSRLENRRKPLAAQKGGRR